MQRSCELKRRRSRVDAVGVGWQDPGHAGAERPKSLPWPKSLGEFFKGFTLLKNHFPSYCMPSLRPQGSASVQKTLSHIQSLQV